MLSNDKKIKACYLKNTLPMLDEPRVVRIKFKKVGKLQYISHLDLQRTVHRILIRAGIPVWYTKGFNPHAKIVFSTPLSVGAQSECELLDIRIDREISCQEIMELLNNEVTDELRILDVYLPASKFSDIAWAGYTIEIVRDGLDGDILDKLLASVDSDTLNVVKKTKSGEKEVNIIPLIKKLSAKLDNGKVVINALLGANSDSYLNPDLLLDALNSLTGILDAEEDKISYTIMRNALYYKDGETEFK